LLDLPGDSSTVFGRDLHCFEFVKATVDVMMFCDIEAELGDWNLIETHDYVANMRMLPKQSLKDTDRVMELHKTLE